MIGRKTVYGDEMSDGVSLPRSLPALASCMCMCRPPTPTPVWCFCRLCDCSRSVLFLWFLVTPKVFFCYVVVILFFPLFLFPAFLSFHCHFHFNSFPPPGHLCVVPLPPTTHPPLHPMTLSPNPTLLPPSLFLPTQRRSPPCTPSPLTDS